MFVKNKFLANMTVHSCSAERQFCRTERTRGTPRLPTLVQASETARDSELARRLWDASSRLTGTGQNLPAAS